MGRRGGGFTRQGTETRVRILERAYELFRQHGLQGITLRGVATRGSLALGTLQFHFRTQDELVAEVIRWWGAQVARTLSDASSGTEGLARTWRLCEAWVADRDAEVLSMATNLGPSAPGRSHPARAAMLPLLDGWIELTVRSLRQAQLSGEVRSDVEVSAVGFDLHRLLWSHGWSSALHGPEASAAQVLAAARRLLAAIAVDPDARLPSLSRGPQPRPRIQLDWSRRGGVEPTWSFTLEPSEPLYHAFVRHELMGDPRTFVYRPEVTPEDEARAAEYRAAHGCELPSRADGEDEDRAPTGWDSEEEEPAHPSADEGDA